MDDMHPANRPNIAHTHIRLSQLLRSSMAQRWHGIVGMNIAHACLNVEIELGEV